VLILQWISFRPDILPSPFLNELRRLCDAVPSFPTDDAMAVVEAELGVKADKYFSDLTAQTQPIAAASLGQVYRLRLAETGDIVAVKVQRPDMLSFVLRDIYIIRRLAQVAEKMKSWVTKQRPYDVALIDTFGTASLQELDYLNEAENQVFLPSA
jgi:aarF domain-containing kinase